MQEQILNALQSAYRDSGRVPVSSVAVASRCYVTDRYARKLLNQMKEAGLVQRIGQRKGWLPA